MSLVVKGRERKRQSEATVWKEIEDDCGLTCGKPRHKIQMRESASSETMNSGLNQSVWGIWISKVKNDQYAAGNTVLGLR